MQPRITAGIAGLIAAAGAVGAIAVPAASAKSRTLRYYTGATHTQFYNARGRAIALDPPETFPSAGDSFDQLGTLYTGTASRHTHRTTASEHLTCRFTSSMSATCDLQIAVGGSLLIFNGFAIHFVSNRAAARLTEASAAFAGDHGTLTAVGIQNPDYELTLALS